MATIWGVLISIDGAIYDLVCYIYEIFYYLATLNIFSQETYQGIVNRIYIVLGLFMLFVLAYSLLKAIISPDNFAKGENSFPNLIKNVVISLVIIAVLPTVFSVAFNIQNVVLTNDTIPRLILGVEEASDQSSQMDAGRTLIAYNAFKAFLYPSQDFCNSSEGSTNWEDCRDKIRGNGAWFVTNGEYLSVMDSAVLSGSSFTNYSGYSEAVRDGNLTYMFPISTVAGIFLCWVLLNYCFDMALRVVKLAFYQIIAPIPVICRILPGGNMKDIFSRWLKQVISVFLEVFIRVAIMAIGVYLIGIFVDTVNTTGLPGIGRLGRAQQGIVVALIIMGIVIFIRQAPQLLSKLFNLDTEGMKLGLMDKLAMGGGLLAGAAAGGLATSGVRNLVGGIRGTAKNVGQARGFKGKASALLGGTLGAVASTVAGAGSGLVRGGFAGKGAKNFKDMVGAASKGAAGAESAKSQRAAYKASHKNVTIAGHDFEVGKIPLVGGVIGAGAGHASDFVHGVAQWAGIDNMQALIDDNKIIDDINARKKGVRSAAEDLIVGESNKAGVRKSFGLDADKYNTEQVRMLRQNMEAAKGTAGYAVAQNAYDSYLKEFVDAVQNQALLGTESWNALDISERADLGEVRIAAKNYRDILEANLSRSYVANSGFNANILDENQSLDVGSGPMKNIGDQLKIAKTENSMKINELRQKQSQNGKNS